MIRPTCLLASCALIALLLFVPASAYPSSDNYYPNEERDQPEDIMDMLTRLGNYIQMDRNLKNEKRTAMDFGLTRGYSGAIQAKHLIGLQAANYAGGPGRRRRDAH